MIEYVSVTASLGKEGEGYISIEAEEAGLECPGDLTHKGTSAFAALIVSLVARVLSCSLRARGTGDLVCPFSHMRLEAAALGAQRRSPPLSYSPERCPRGGYSLFGYQSLEGVVRCRT